MTGGVNSASKAKTVKQAPKPISSSHLEYKFTA